MVFSWAWITWHFSIGRSESSNLRYPFLAVFLLVFHRNMWCVLGRYLQCKKLWKSMMKVIENRKRIPLHWATEGGEFLHSFYPLTFGMFLVLLIYQILYYFIFLVSHSWLATILDVQDAIKLKKWELTPHSESDLFQIYTPMFRIPSSINFSKFSTF